MANSASISIIDLIKSTDPPLTTLWLFKPLSDYNVDFDDFVSALQQNSSIDSVCLEKGCVGKITEQVFTELLHAVTSVPNLLKLKIHGARVPLASVCRAVAKHHKIQTVYISVVRLFEWSDCSALAEHLSLKSFTLTSFTTYPQGTDADVRAGLDTLLTALSTCPVLEKVVIGGYKGRGVPVSANGVGALANSPSLKSLMLSDLSFIDADLLVFSRNLLRQRSSALQDLHLDGNRLQDLTALNQAVSEHQSLKTLSLSRNRLTATSCVGLVTAIARSTIENLILMCNTLGDEGADSLALLLRTSSLKSLELHRTQLTDRGCVLLAHALETNTFLEALSLSCNDITEESYVAFSSALTRNCTLKRINLLSDRRGALTVVGANALLDMVKNNYVIEDITGGLGPRDELPTITNDIRTFLRLNRAGRKRLVQGPSSRRDWLEVIAKVGYDLDAVHYLVRANPFLCDRNECDGAGERDKCEPEGD